MRNLDAVARMVGAGLDCQPAGRPHDAAPELAAGSTPATPRLRSLPFALALLIVVGLAVALWWTA